MAGKILVVEDNLEVLHLWEFILRLEGYSVITAFDGEEGLRKALRERPSLILADVSMPNMDGVEMIKRLRSRAETHDLPVLVVTAYGESAAEEALRAGANYVLEKPAEAEAVLDLVGRCLVAQTGLA